MRFTLEKPALVKEAIAAQEGKGALGEIGTFILVFLMITLGEIILMFPFALILTLSNSTAILDFFGISIVTEEDALYFAFSLEEVLAAGEKSAYLLVMSLFLTIAMIVVVIYYCKKRQKRSLRTLGFVKENAGKEYLKGLIFGFLMFSGAVLICVITGAMEIEGLSQNFVPLLFVIFVIGFLIQGMAEEVMMRGYFLVSFARRHSVMAAVMANSLLFSVLHLFNSGISLLALVNLTLFGIFASIYFVKSENIWGVGALHSMWNLVQGNIYGAQVSGTSTYCSVFSSSLVEGMELINGGAFGLEGGLAVTFVLVIGILILFWRYQAALKVSN